MKAAYWVAHVDVHDPDTYAEYAKRAGPAIAAHGGEFLARGGAVEQFEGQGRARNVVIRFPSMEAARTCYHSAAYQEAVSYAKPSSTRELLIVEAVE